MSTADHFPHPEVPPRPPLVFDRWLDLWRYGPFPADPYLLWRGKYRAKVALHLDTTRYEYGQAFVSSRQPTEWDAGRV